MIKKLLIFLLFGFCLLFLGNSTKATFEYMQVGLGQNQSYWNTNYDIGVIKKGRFISTYLGLSKNVLALDNQKLYFWNNGGLYFFNDTFSLQGYLQYMTSCDEITLSGEVENCGNPSVVGLFDEVVGNFINSLVPGDWIMVEQYPTYNLGCGSWCTYDRFYTRVCFSSSTYHHTLCFLGDYSNYNTAGYKANYPLGSSLGLASTTTFGNINRNLLGEPPAFTAGENIDGGNQEVGDSTLSGDVLYSELSTGDAIKYIEASRGFNKNICYVGTTDYDSLRGTSSSFNEGQGGTIFDLYNHYYGDYNYSSYGLQSVANFIESWVINYYQWFLTDGNPSRLAFYNSGSGLYSYRYENLTFPFENNPYAVYFMASNIHGYVNYFGDSQDLQGSAVVDYCNLLLNGGTVEEMITPGLKQGFIENSERNQLAPGQAFDYSGMQYKVDGSSWNGVFDSSSGAVIVDGTNFINTFFNKVKSSVLKPDSSNNIGTLPTYILVFMCAIIFFRFLRH